MPMPVRIALLALLAALLSAGYVVHYLRGGPRIIDATSYWLEARTIATLAFTFAPPAPLASFSGRFLEVPGEPDRLGVIFPPGYPILLALGFLAGVPLAIGPMLAAALVVATFALGRATTQRDDVALLAALLSVLSAALRYHTADTMSHGWAALLGTLTLVAALRAGPRAAVLAGITAGWLVATRPVSGVVFGALAVAALGPRPRRWGLFALGALPGLALLVAHQHAVTGEFLASSQLRYYSLADGPAGCFHYGFGPEIGCRYEHGEFVARNLPHGFGAWEAGRVTFNRLFVHLRDAGNAPILAPLIVVGALAGRKEPMLLWPTLGIVGLVLAYVPFYFDGSYPGAGARLYADALPLEHVLLAQGLVAARLSRAAVPFALGGFAWVASGDHRLLADREGGRPFFEPGVIEASGVRRGLLFVDSDHAFNLGFDPKCTDARSGIVVARTRRDANDYLLWEGLGRPATYTYLGPLASEPSRLEPRPMTVPASLRFEGESHWTLAELENGWAHPDYPPCASQGRALRLRAADGQPVARLPIMVPLPGRYRIVAGWASQGRVRGRIALAALGRRMEVEVDTPGGRCWETSLGSLVLPKGELRLEVRGIGDYCALDYVELSPAPIGSSSTGLGRWDLRVDGR
ncbi:MAG: hypothetical protein JW751_06000 [Polyangiaceae bacterium]|nr:hypothetical protein [Polyangiaceae bacterium]